MSKHPAILINNTSIWAKTFNISAYVKACVKELSEPFEQINITFIDIPTICQLHQDYLNDPSPTDIITFNLEEPNDPIIGDIYICPEIAIEHAKTLHHTAELEIKTLIIHGLLHLIGYTDTTPSQKKIMFKRQTELVEKLG